MRNQLVRQAIAPLRSVYASSITAPAAVEAMASLGLDGMQGYYAVRTLALGPVPPLVVQALFFGHSPAFHQTAGAGVWDRVTPAEVLAATHDGLDRSLGPVYEELGATARELTRFLRTAAERASTRPEGRGLFAANASLPWPEKGHHQLWHAHVLLREWRGDGHNAILVAEDIDAREALLIHGAWAGMPLLAITTSRQWTADQCAPVVAGLQAKGWLTDEAEPTITDEGRRRRDSIEDATDEADAFAYEGLSDIELARLVDLAAVVGAEVSARVVQPGVRPTGRDKSVPSR
jgi:hypothetical protein